MGPTGSPLSLSDLPAAGAVRWVARRKAEVVCAVRGGLLTLDEVRVRYKLSVDEFMAWSKSYAEKGLDGLKPTRRR